MILLRQVPNVVEISTGWGAVYINAFVGSLFTSRKCTVQNAKSPNIMFHENPFSRRRVVQCGRTDGRVDRQTERHDEALSNFANAPKNSHFNREPNRNGKKNVMFCSY
jgi:hypothetical protein